MFAPMNCCRSHTWEGNILASDRLKLRDINPVPIPAQVLHLKMKQRSAAGQLLFPGSKGSFCNQNEMKEAYILTRKYRKFLIDEKKRGRVLS